MTVTITIESSDRRVAVTTRETGTVSTWVLEAGKPPETFYVHPGVTLTVREIAQATLLASQETSP